MKDQVINYYYYTKEFKLNVLPFLDPHGLVLFLVLVFLIHHVIYSSDGDRMFFLIFQRQNSQSVNFKYIFSQFPVYFPIENINNLSTE